MKKFHIHVGPVVVVIKEKLILIEPPWAGNRGPHFTAFFAPRIKGAELVWSPHLTNGVPKEWFDVPVRALRAWVFRLLNDMVQAWLAAHRRVELAEIEADGWEVCLPDDAVLERMAAVVQGKVGHVHLDSERVMGAVQIFGSELEQHLIAPTVVEPAICNLPLHLIGPEGERALLLYYPVPRGALLAGWYLVPNDWGLTQVLERHVPDSVRVVLEKVKTFLGLAADAAQMP